MSSFDRRTDRYSRFVRFFIFKQREVEPAPVFIGRIFTHTSLLSLASRQGLPADNASSVQKSAPEKLPCTFRREMFGLFRVQRTKACWRKSRTISPKEPDSAVEMRRLFNSPLLMRRRRIFFCKNFRKAVDIFLFKEYILLEHLNDCSIVTRRT